MRVAFLLAVLAVVVPASAATLLGDITLDVRDGAVIFANDAVELGIDSGTGNWTNLRDMASGATVLHQPAASATVDALLGDKWLCADGEAGWRYAGRKVVTGADRATLQVTQEQPGWRVTVSYTLLPGQPVVMREMSLEPTADQPEKIRSVRFVLDGVSVPGAPDTQYSLLANWPPHRTPFADLQAGRNVGESWGSQAGHFAVVHSASAGLGVAATVVCDTEGAGLSVAEQEQAVCLNHSIGAQYAPRKGKAEQFGTQLIKITRGDWRDTLRQGRDLYDLVRLTPPPDMLAEAQETVFYSAHVGGTIDSGFRDVGGFKQFAEYLPELKRLGIDVLWLLPTWKGFVYAPTDYFALDPNLGTEEEMKALVDQAHGLGMRVLGDLIPHGPRDESGLHKEHRDWVSTREDGEMQYWWGCLSCDYAHPGWQGYMGEHAAYWVRKVGLDGYRVDCAGGGPYNWAPYGDNRPSMSGMGGGVEILRAAREKMHEDKEKVLLLAEAAGVPLLRYADYAYDWPLCWTILKEMPDRRAAEFVPQLAQWLENEQYWLPKGGNLMHFLENHDSVRARAVHGPGLERALMALCAYIPGSPFVYHFQEIGMAPYLSRLYQVRRALPELMRGEADFISVKSDQPSVMAFSRTWDGQTSVVAINFEGRPQTCSVTLPDAISGLAASAVDAITGAEVGSPGTAQITLQLDPYQCAVITTSGRDVPAPVQWDRPTMPGWRETLEQAEGDQTLQVGEVTGAIDADRGGLLEVGTPGGDCILQVADLSEGKRRLWLGSERLSLAQTPATLTRTDENGEAVVKAVGRFSRSAEAGGNTVADYEITYRKRGADTLDVTYTLTAREAVVNTLGSLAETIRLDPDATEWVVRTREGVLHDWAMPRRPRDTNYGGRYWKGTGDRVWQSSELGVAFDDPAIGVKEPGGRWVLLRIKPTGDDLPHNVKLKMRDGETPMPHVVIDWLDGTKPINIAAGESLTFGYSVQVTDAPGNILRDTLQQFTSGPVTLTVRGSRYEMTNGLVDLCATRFSGGKLADLRLTGDDVPVISGSRIYTDGGLYSERTLPDMRQIPDFVTTDNDPETSVVMDASEDGLRLEFAGRLRTHDGCGTASPSTHYRVSYAMDGTDIVRMKSGVRPMITAPDAEAFLAHTLTLPDANGFVANGREGVQSGTLKPGDRRVWESKMSGFAGEPWFVCKTRAGRSLRIAGDDLARSVYNVFLHGSGGGGVLFFAYHDWEPAPILPRWQEADFTLQVTKEAD